MEGLEVRDPLAGRHEGDRLADDLLHGERRAAAGVAVDLGQDDAVERRGPRGRPGRLRRRPGPSSRRRRGRCSSGCTASETRRTSSISSSSIASRPAVSTMTTSRPRRSASARPRRATLDRIGRLGEDRRHRPRRPSTRSCSTAAGRCRSAPTRQRVAPLLAEPAGQLGRGRRLARALQAGEQHDRRRLARRR